MTNFCEFENSSAVTQNDDMPKIHLLWPFFNKWKNFVSRKKIDNFVDVLKRNKEAKRKNPDGENLPKKRMSLSGSCYKHRFEAQRHIIESQKKKLLQQRNTIRDLKLKKLNEGVCQAERETKRLYRDAREMIKRTSVSIRPSVVSPRPNTFHVGAAHVPRLVRELEKKADERAHRRQIIAERKRARDQHRAQVLREEIRLKETLKIEEREKLLEELAQRRKRELQIHEKMREREEKLRADCEKVARFHARLLKKRTLSRLRANVTTMEKKCKIAEDFYSTMLTRKCWHIWFRYISERCFEKLRAAENFYNSKLKVTVFNTLKKLQETKIKHNQVAQDFHDFKLSTNTLTIWLRYVHNQRNLYARNLEKAQKHYTSRTLLNYLYRWKILPTVMRLERMKEIKKQKWREKVWEIVPDYNPLRSVDEVKLYT